MKEEITLKEAARKLGVTMRGLGYFLIKEKISMVNKGQELWVDKEKVEEYTKKPQGWESSKNWASKLGITRQAVTALVKQKNIPHRVIYKPKGVIGDKRRMRVYPNPRKYSEREDVKSS